MKSPAQYYNIDLDYTSVEFFIELCKSKAFSIKTIDELMSLEAYDKIALYSKNNLWGIDKKDITNFFYGVFISEEYINPTKYNLDIHKKIIDYIKWAKINWKTIDDNIKILKKKINRNIIIEKTAKYLPLVKDPTKIQIYVSIGIGQGAGYKDYVILDGFYDKIDNFNLQNIHSFIAHEAHHCFRNVFSKEYSYSEIFQTLFWLESEGIAMLAQFDSIEPKINYDEINELLYNYNDVLIKKLLKKEKLEENAILESLNWKYHEIGHWMAYIIEKHIGHEALIKCVGDPKMFINSYQKAALKYNDSKVIFIFDEDVIEAIHDFVT